jgi:sugar phosphate isomerase/epimerase
VTPDFSLAHLTVLPLAPPDMVAVAARTGYRYVGLRLLAATPGGVAYPLMRDRAMMRETKARLADTGVAVLDIEIVRLEPYTAVESFIPFMEAGAELGARHVITAGNDPDRARLIARFAALCEAAAPFGLTIALEFYPWTDVPDLPSAAAVVAAAGRRNSGILVDVLHFHRTGGLVEDLDRIPDWRLPFVHLCDAPAAIPATTEALILTARSERLLPGEGGIDIGNIMRHMPANIPVALEVPMERLTALVGPEECARRARAAAGHVLAPVESLR